MRTNSPLVTAIAVCYNHSRFVVECLESIRNQTYRSIQLIIIDDCSTDNSVVLIRDWIDRHKTECTFIAHRKNQGICKTLNEALRLANGKYISMIAADDVWMLDKIEHQVNQMEEQSEDMGVLYSDAFQIDESGALLPGMFIETHRKLTKLPQGEIFATLLEGNFIPAMTTLIRRSCYDRVGYYDEKLSYEDWDMWLRVAQQYKFVPSDKVSAKYRVVPTSLLRTLLTEKKMEMHRSQFMIYAKWLECGALCKGQKTMLLERLNGITERMYESAWGGRSLYLWTLFRHDRRPRTLGMFLFSSLGIRYSHFCRFYSWYGRLRLKAIEKLSVRRL